jgi:hypothetical protein
MPYGVGRWPWRLGLGLLGALCLQTGLNWAVRYTLPALALLFVSLGHGLRVALGRRWGAACIAACLLWNAIEFARTRPDFLSYGNLLAGGAAAAHRDFLGSNYDWGQDLAGLKRWSDEHPAVRPLVHACYGGIDPRLLGLPITGIPGSPSRRRSGALTGRSRLGRSPITGATSGVNGCYPGPGRASPAAPR